MDNEQSQPVSAEAAVPVDMAWHVAAAIAEVLSERFGDEFVADMRASMAARADRWAQSDDAHERAAAPIVKAFALDDEKWTVLKTAASGVVRG